MDELKPCPFCGGEAHLYSDYCGERDGTRYNLYHECDGHEGESAGYGYGYKPWFETPWYKTEAEAIEAWNTRIEQTCHEIMVDKYFHGCGSCGYVWEVFYNFGKRERPKYCPECGLRVAND